MIRETFCPGLAGKTIGTRFPAIPILIILFFLALGGGKATAVTWQAQGPSPILGGATVIVPDNPVVGAVQLLIIDPNDNNTKYAGAVNGGIWKTTNGGGTWTPPTDGLHTFPWGAWPWTRALPAVSWRALEIFPISEKTVPGRE
jgi:hypothetical protein